MKDSIVEFNKVKNFLVCVDSDGCVMDTMDIKHQECFAPQAIKEWKLQDISGVFIETWNKVNLYSKTRGINRFKGLVRTFEILEEQGIETPDFSSVKQWVNTTTELSNPALTKAIEQTKDGQLVKTLSWSLNVNTAIAALPTDDEPFLKSKEGLERIGPVADIAIVSSANGSAIRSEWTRHGLDSYVDVMLGQEAGSKAFCIDTLKEKGYLPDQVLMIGDAPGDLEAALENAVLYYPILVGKEKFSWERLISEALDKFIEGNYRGKYQQDLIDEFNAILK